MGDTLEIVVPNEVVGLFADDVEFALKRIRFGAIIATANKDLPDHRFHGLYALAKPFVVHRHIAPAQNFLPLDFDGALDSFDADIHLAASSRQEHHANGVIAGGGQRKTQLFRFFSKESVGDLR